MAINLSIGKVRDLSSSSLSEFWTGELIKSMFMTFSKCKYHQGHHTNCDFKYLVGYFANKVQVCS